MAFPNDPADVNAPAYTGGSTLGDFLAGTGGSTLSRPAVGLQIANGQAMAGYRSVQTELALQKAQEHVEREQALGGLQDQFVAAGMKPSEAAASVGYIRATGRDPLEVMKALQAGDERTVFGLVADPNTPEPLRVAGIQALKKNADVGQFKEVQGQYTDIAQPGQLGATTQTPLSTSVINKNNAEASAANQRAAGTQMDPEIAPIVARFIDQNPNLAANMRSLTNGGGPLVAAAFMAEHGDAAAQQYLARKSGQAPAAAAVGAGGGPAAPPADTHGGAPTSSASAGGAPVPFDGQVSDPHQIILPAPGVSLKEQADIRHDYASSKGAGGRVGFLNTMAAHSRLFDLIADQVDHGNFTPTNTIKDLWNKTFGKTPIVDLRLAGSFLGREAVRATINSGAGTGEERELQVPDNASPAQLHDAANTLRSLGAHQLRTLDNAARRGGVNILQLLDPETRNDFGHLGGFTVAAPTPGAAPAAGGGVDLASAAAAELARRSGAH